MINNIKFRSSTLKKMICLSYYKRYSFKVLFELFVKIYFANQRTYFLVSLRMCQP
ncbi:hypothetical protein RIR_e14255_A0A2N1MTP3_9GLOM [Rhizophagus irregularis DAOM 181602=DAOM 197198]|nr:hypothetical protein RIR_e14255_A0A2N1MTP3_9GLOM [Rhizophagus irregularis DAOM 181602=DAOM 197198]